MNPHLHIGYRLEILHKISYNLEILNKNKNSMAKTLLI